MSICSNLGPGILFAGAPNATQNSTLEEEGARMHTHRDVVCDDDGDASAEESRLEADSIAKPRGGQAELAVQLVD